MATVTIRFKTTHEERVLIHTLANGNMSDYLRGLVRADAKARGIAIPDNILDDTRATHGGLNRHDN